MDGVDSHEKYCDELDLPFDLLADPDRKIHEAYGFKKRVRALILVGADGKIRFVDKEFKLTKEEWEALMKEIEALRKK